MPDVGNQTGDVIARILDITKDEVKRLAGADVLIKTGPDKYNLFGSVKGYIQYLREQNKRAPTQIEVAEHLDMSERNARDILSVLQIDWRESTMSKIRVAYIRDLREKAAGRGGDDQYQLTKNRAREADMSATLKELQIAEKTGILVPAADVEALIVAIITAARTELLTLPDKIAMDIKALEGVDIDPSLIQEHIHESLQHLANGLPSNTTGNAREGAADLGAAAQADDDRVGG